MVRVAFGNPTLTKSTAVTTAVDKWPAYARLLAVAPAGHLPTAPTPLPGTRPLQAPRRAGGEAAQGAVLPGAAGSGVRGQDVGSPVCLSGGCHLASGGSQRRRVAPEAEAAAVEQTAPNVAFVSYDEKPGIQAISNTAPDLPPVAGKHACVARDHEYKRHGTLSLLAGIDLLTGQVHACVEDRHRSREFIGFLKKLDAAYSCRYRDQGHPGQSFGACVEGNEANGLPLSARAASASCSRQSMAPGSTWSKASSRRWRARSCVTSGWLRKPNSSNGSWHTSTTSIASLLSTRGPTKSHCPAR